MTPVRTIIDVPADQLERLDAYCRAEGISRAEAIRRAVDAHVRAPRPNAPAAFGLWAGRRIDGVTYERALRREWSRGGPGVARSGARRRRPRAR